MTHASVGLALSYWCPNTRPGVLVSPGLLRRAPLPTAQPRPEGRAPLTHAPERCEMAAAARGAEAPPPPLPLSSCPRRHCGIPRRVAGQSGPRARQERYKKAGTARGSITCCRQPPHSRRAFPPAGSGGIQAAPASRQERPRFRPRLGRWRRAPRAVTSILCPHPASAAPIWSRAGEEGAGAGGGVTWRQGGLRAARALRPLPLFFSGPAAHPPPRPPPPVPSRPRAASPARRLPRREGRKGQERGKEGRGKVRRKVGRRGKRKYHRAGVQRQRLPALVGPTPTAGPAHEPTPAVGVVTPAQPRLARGTAPPPLTGAAPAPPPPPGRVRARGAP